MLTLFFSDNVDDVIRARSVCADCPALVPCLEGAVARREPWGVWGGQLFMNGRILMSAGGRGRPPKEGFDRSKVHRVDKEEIPKEFHDRLRRSKGHLV